MTERRPVAVPPRLLVCERLPVHAKHGFSGKSIEFFPPYAFFKLYQANRQEGIDAFKDWYRHRFIRDEEWRIEKSEGGLKKGPLHRLVLEMHGLKGKSVGSDGEAFDARLVEQAIEQRVLHYFALLDSLGKSGYLYSKGFVRCVESAYGDQEIVAGHHRVAAAHALGFAELTVLVSPDERPKARAQNEREPFQATTTGYAEGTVPEWGEQQIKSWIGSQDWYQRIPVREGIVTPGKFDSLARLKKLNLPSLQEKTVLDIGCNSGMYSFECERLGARRVVGIDLNEKRLLQARTLKEILNSKVHFQRMSLHDALSLGKFDYVLCIAVLHETPDLLGALAVLKEIANIGIHLEISLWKPPLLKYMPLAKLGQTKRGRTLLPTRRLLEEVFGDSFIILPRGPSVRYDLFHLIRIEPREGVGSDPT